MFRLASHPLLFLSLGLAFLSGVNAATRNSGQACAKQYLCPGSKSEYIVHVTHRGECKQSCIPEEKLVLSKGLLDWSCGPCPASTQSQRKERRLQNLNKEELLAEEAKVLAIDWEWIIFKYLSVNSSFPKDTVPKLSVRAVVDEELNITFSDEQRISLWEYPPGTSSYRIGLVAYAKSSATSLEVNLTNNQNGDILIQQQVAFPINFDQWTNVTIEQDGVQVNMSFKRSDTPIISSAEQDAMIMSMTEELIDLENGEKASLAYKINDPANTKAVLYFAGRFDTLGNPHLLEFYANRGYDFYTLDPRKCGRTIKFLDHPYDMNYVTSFDEYKEEIDYTMNFIRGQKNYTEILGQGFSTGALTLINYVIGDGKATTDSWDGYVFTGALLDWGFVTPFEEFALEHSDLARLFVGPYAIESTGISTYQTRVWLLYQMNVTWQTLIDGHTTFDWAKAATTVHEKINKRGWIPWSSAVTSKPLLSLTSLGDDIQISAETVERLPKISSNFESVVFDYNAHDVFRSFTEALSDNAFDTTGSWLDTKFP